MIGGTSFRFAAKLEKCGKYRKNTEKIGENPEENGKSLARLPPQEVCKQLTRWGVKASNSSGVFLECTSYG